MSAVQLRSCAFWAGCLLAPITVLEFVCYGILLLDAWADALRS
jgi:hypothetical protein